MKIGLIVLLSYIALMVFLGFITYKKEDEKGFLLGGAMFGPVMISVSFIATYFSTSAYLGGGGAGYIFGFGWSAYLTMFHILFAVMSWAFIAPKIKDFVEKENILTIPQFFGKRYNSNFLQVLSALIILVFFEFYMISIYKGAGHLLQTLLGLPYVYGVMLTAIPVILYTSIGGFRAVVITDFIQGVLLLLGGVILFGVMVYKMGGILAGIEALKHITLPGGVPGSALLKLGGYGPPPIMKAGMMIPFLISLTLAISIAQLASPQLVIRFFAAKDKKVIKKGMLLTPILIAIFALTVFSIGPFARLFLENVKNPDMVIPLLIKKLMPPVIAAIMIVAILSAAMSTINSNLMILASSLTKDILKINNVTIHRISVVILGLISPILAINPPGIIVTIVGLAFSVITAAFLVPLVAGLYSQHTTKVEAIITMVTSVVVCIVWQLFYYKKYFIYPVIPGLIASFIAYYITSSLRKATQLKPKPAEEE